MTDTRFRPKDRPLEERLMEIAMLEKPVRYIPILAEYMIAIHDLKLKQNYVMGQLYAKHCPYNHE